MSVVREAPRRAQRFEVLEHAASGPALKVLAALEELGVVIRVQEADVKQLGPELPECACCGALMPVVRNPEARVHPALEREVCPVCWSTADMLLREFEDAKARHEDEFRHQFVQMVKDVRSGADAPTFYRGFE